MSRAEYRKAAENAKHDARAASTRTFVTGFPLLIGLAALASLLWNEGIRWGAAPGGTFMAFVMLAQAICLFRFAAVLGYRSLCHGHWVFAFFCLGPILVLANVALVCAGAGFSTLHQGDASTWVLVTLILVSVPLGLMIDLKYPAPVPRRQPGRTAVLSGIAGWMLLLTGCIVGGMSYGHLTECLTAAGVTLLTLICLHAGMWKCRAARRRAEVNNTPIPTVAQESSQP